MCLLGHKTYDPLSKTAEILAGVTGPFNTGEPRYLELAYFELPLISKRKSGPCFNMKL